MLSGQVTKSDPAGCFVEMDSQGVTGKARRGREGSASAQGRCDVDGAWGASRDNRTGEGVW